MESLFVGVDLANKLMFGLVGCFALWLIWELVHLAILKKDQARMERMTMLYSYAKMVSDMVACRAAEYALACEPEIRVDAACTYYLSNMPKMMLTIIDAYEAEGNLVEWVESLMAANVMAAANRERSALSCEV